MHKKHNVSVLLNHPVCPTKYRRAVITPDVDEKLKEIGGEISLRCEIEFPEIGTDSDHVNVLVQSEPIVLSDENGANHKKYHRQRNLSADAGSKKATEGRRILHRAAITSAPLAHIVPRKR